MRSLGTNVQILVHLVVLLFILIPADAADGLVLLRLVLDAQPLHEALDRDLPETGRVGVEAVVDSVQPGQDDGLLLEALPGTGQTNKLGEDLLRRDSHPLGIKWTLTWGLMHGG